MMNPITVESRQGAIYLITLITITAIVSMVLIGVSLRSAGNVRSAIIEEMSESSIGVLNASEYAIEVIGADPMWRITAQGGDVFTKFTLGDLTYSGKVRDASTGVKPTYTTTTYRIEAKSKMNAHKRIATFDLLANEMDYTSYLISLGAIYYWPMDEHSNPALALDLIKGKNGNYLVPSVAGAAMNDEAGLVPVFANKNDHIVVPWAKDMKQIDGSISLWMKCTGANKWTDYPFLGMRYVSGGPPVINMSVWGYAIVAYIEDTGSFSVGNFTLTALDSITPRSWYHIVMTWGVSGLRVYVDGILLASDPGNTNGVKTPKAGSGGEQPLHLGAGYRLSGGTQPSQGFEGSISHVGYFNRILTAKEVAALAAIKPDKLEYTLVKDSWTRVFN